MEDAGMPAEREVDHPGSKVGRRGRAPQLVVHEAKRPARLGQGKHRLDHVGPGPAVDPCGADDRVARVELALAT